MIATSSAQDSYTALTDDVGRYKLGDLPPGTYRVVFYYADVVAEQAAEVQIDHVTALSQHLDAVEARQVVHSRRL